MVVNFAGEGEPHSANQLTKMAKIRANEFEEEIPILSRKKYSAFFWSGDPDYAWKTASIPFG